MSNSQGQIKQRLLSLDIFRGITVASMILVNSPGDWSYIYPPLRHAEWNGCTPTDLVFPSFLFMVGVALVYSMQGKKIRGESHGPIILGAFRRMIILILIGWSIQLFYRPDFSHLRIPGVLQRIGIVYFLATLIYLKSNERVMTWMFFGILAGYFLTMKFIPLPDGTSTDLAPDTNLAAYIDRLVFSENHLWRLTKTWDPLGLITTVPAVATALFGIKAGTCLKDTRKSEKDKTIELFNTGIIAIVLGLITDWFFPINKALWTSSYVLYSGGICTLGLTVAYWYIDVKQQMKFLWPFLVFGTNAISAYVLSELLPGILAWIQIDVKGQTVTAMKFLYTVVFLPSLRPEDASLLSAACFVFVVWLFMYPLYRKKILIKI